MLHAKIGELSAWGVRSPEFANWRQLAADGHILVIEVLEMPWRRLSLGGRLPTFAPIAVAVGWAVTKTCPWRDWDRVRSVVFIGFHGGFEKRFAQ